MFRIGTLISKTMPDSTFDALDFKIIHILNKNGRVSSSEIARQVGANERTIRKRIDRLVEIGAIRLAAIVNPQVFGYSTVVDVFLEISPEREMKVIGKLRRMPAIAYIASGQGTHDLSIQARFKGNAEMRDFLRYILPSIPGVKVNSYSLVPNILKNLDEWMPPEGR